MKKRFLLLVIFCMFVLSTGTFFLVLNYMDPYVYKIIGIVSMIITIILGISSFCTLLFYFIKKIHYRGKVNITHVLTSFRQGFFISLFLLGLVLLSMVGANLYITGILVSVIFILSEMFIQNLEQ